MKRTIIFCFCISLFLVSCSKEETSPSSPSSNQVNLANPEVGQVSYFKRYTTNCSDIENNFSYTEDVLKLEVSKEDDQLYFTESFTLESPLFIAGNTTPIKYEVFLEGTDLLIPSRKSSTLFFFYGNDTIHLAPESRINLVQNACVFMQDSTQFIGNDIGHFQRFEIGPLMQQNKTAVSCVPMFINLDAYLIYDQKKLYMSHTISGEDVSGWVAN